jgi:hypothetical protein
MNPMMEDGRQALTETLADEARAAEVAMFATMIAALDEMLINADSHPDRDSDFHLDDEPLHWCATEVASNLRAALWAAGAGFYSTTLLAAERALHLSVASLAYTIQDSGLQVEGEAPLLPKFSEWESGASLPTEMMLVRWLQARQAARPALPAGVESPEDHYRWLVRQLRAERNHHHFQRGWRAPGFEAEGYRLAADALRDVLDTIAGIWLVELPHLRTRALPAGFFTGGWGRAVRGTWV